MTAEPTFPRVALIGGAVLVGMSLTLATVVRLSGMDIRSFPNSQPVRSRSIDFVDSPSGAVLVYDAKSHQQIESLPPGTNGFVRATMRNFARERRSHSLGSAAPFELTATQDGRLVLADPATGRQIDLEAFGPTNAGAFASFLNERTP